MGIAMKKIRVLFFAGALLLAGRALYPHDAVTDDSFINNTTAADEGLSGKDAGEKEADEKIKTRAFDNGCVVIRGEKSAVIDKATSHKVVTEKDIEARNDKGLDDTLDNVAGFQTYQHGKGHIRFKMRGFEMPYVAILVDGIPLADVYEANLDISKIPVMNASEIIINRGTCSALYGTTGTIGSINVISKKPLGLYAKSSIELGANGDYTINMAQGDAIENFYYWITVSAEREAPFEVSAKLTKSERQKWFNKFYPAVYTYADTTADAEYLDHTGEWPHQEAFRYNVAGKFGYTVFTGLEVGLNMGYTKSEATRYSNDLKYNTASSTYDSTTDYRWEWKNPSSYGLYAGAFSWQDIYTVNISPYASYEKGKFKITGNVFYLYNSEYLDGYADADETAAISGWGGAHSNWNNTSAGFNIFPTYRLFNWNTISTSLLFRWDKHLERQQADAQFAGGSSACYAASYALVDGYDWFNTKLMTGEQFTFGLEDQIDFQNYIGIPVEMSVGFSYDAQNLDTFKKRAETRASGVVTAYGTTMDDQYIAKDDSLIWGTRDSFNPVIGIVYEPLKNFLLLRTSFSKKSKLPTMAQYAKLDTSSDTGDLKTETSYNSNAGFELFFLNKALSFRTDYFFTRFDDKIACINDPDVNGNRIYTNIKGEDHQGVEAIVTACFEDVAGIVSSIYTECSYTYLRVRNLDTGNQDSELYKGEKLADIPEHQFLADVRFNFKSGTSLNLFGSYTANAIKYVMKSTTTAGELYSNSYYRTVTLHDPLMINVKISQTFMNRYEVFAMCRNIMDDYAADPFNPGPGRQFSFGVKAEL